MQSLLRSSSEGGGLGFIQDGGGGGGGRGFSREEGRVAGGDGSSTPSCSGTFESNT